MILGNLNELGAIAKEKSLTYKNIETTLPLEFKVKFSELLREKTTDSIEFQKYTAIVTTSKDLKIIFPNQWFYLASFFFDFLNSIWYYKNIVTEFAISNDIIKELRGNEIPENINLLIDAKFEENEDKVYFKKFLTDYNWWFGSKTIDRGDFFVSPVLKQATVVNETSTYIATIAYLLSLSEDLTNLLTIFSNDTQSEKKSNIIFYGAPGTGKSHRIEKILQEYPDDQKEIITFHPDYDYSSFVGGYKPSSDETTGDIKYKFIPQVFTNIYVEAWKNPSKKYFLAIEEINRGNCAEIFGDLFQLLDRKSNYSISPLKELKEHLEIALSGSEGIEGGKIKLPPNLYILASMNTSDQSLFPMDSAFKRRWSWEYVPINYEPKNEDNSENESYNYVVKIDERLSFNWIEFIESINIQIKSNRNLGSDKCIGNYFIKPDDNEISLDEFINKVMFYLWIDVFKDEDESIFSLIGQNISYEDFFPINSNGKNHIIKLLSPELLDVEITETVVEPQQ